MRALIPGYRYELDHFEHPANKETIQFIHKDAAMQTITGGTTNEEVLAMLIDRLRFLGEKLPCRENSIAVTKIEEALLWLNKRTADRKARGVEGTSRA